MSQVNELIRHIKLEDLLPNPYQPTTRIEIEPEIAEKFAHSIQEHGLIQMPIVRPGKEDSKYEVGDGWLRKSGFQYLADNHKDSAYSEMPCIVKDLTDQQMADLVMEANIIRKDLNPIELAQFYKRYLEDFKIQQGKLAKRHNCSQGEIANTIRLLDLPADVQEKIISQEISPTHGRQLLRLNNKPKLQAKALREAIERNETVTETDRSINLTIWNESHSLNPQAERYQSPPAFDLTECKDCPNNVKAAEPWGDRKKEDRCLDVDCWEKKQQAAKQEMIDKALAEMKDKGEATNILTSDQIGWNERESLKHYKTELDNPAECDHCSKTALFKYNITDKEEPERICTDPACYRKKKTKRTKLDNVTRKQEDKVLTTKLGNELKHVHEHPRECLLLLTRKEVNMLSAAGRADFLLMFSGLPTVSNGRMDLEKTKASLETKTFEELLQLAMAAYITNRRRNSWEPYSTMLNKDLATDFNLITGSNGDKSTRKNVKDDPVATDPLANLVIKTPSNGDESQYIFKLGDIEVRGYTLQECLIGLANQLGWSIDKRAILRKLKELDSSSNAKLLAGILEEQGEATNPMLGELPCTDCANRETCDRSRFYSDDDGKLVCDKKS